MDHTAFTLQIHDTCLKLPSKRSPDGTTNDYSSSSHLITAYYTHYRPREVCYTRRTVGENATANMVYGRGTAQADRHPWPGSVSCKHYVDLPSISFGFRLLSDHGDSHVTCDQHDSLVVSAGAWFIDWPVKRNESEMRLGGLTRSSVIANESSRWSQFTPRIHESESRK